MFGVSERNFLNGLGARFLADGMSAHAIGDDEDMSDLAEIVFVGRFLDGKSVLVMAAPDADIGHSGMFEIVKTWHEPPSETFFIESSHHVST